MIEMMCCIFRVISPVAKQLQQWYVHKSPTISLTSTTCYDSVQKWLHNSSLAQMEMQVVPIVNTQQRVKNGYHISKYMRP